LLNLVVDEHGVPQNVHVVRGVGLGLDAKAVDAVKQWRFKPAMENGTPVPVELNIEMNFRFVPDPPSGPNASLHVPFRTATPVLIASLDALPSPFSGKILAGPEAMLRSYQLFKAAPAAQPGVASEPAPAQQKAPAAKEQPKSQYQFSDDQRVRIEADIAAAKREAGDATKRYNSPEFKKQIEDAQRQAMEAVKQFDAQRLNTPEFKAQMDELKRQAMEATKQFNSADLQKALANAKLQILDAKKFDSNSVEFRKQIEELRKELETAAEELREARDLANPPDKK